MPVERPPLRKTKRNGTRNTQIPLGTYRSHNPDPHEYSLIRITLAMLLLQYLLYFFCLCGSVMFTYCALVLIFTFMRYFFRERRRNYRMKSERRSLH